MKLFYWLQKQRVKLKVRWWDLKTSIQFFFFGYHPCNRSEILADTNRIEKENGDLLKQLKEYMQGVLDD